MKKIMRNHILLLLVISLILLMNIRTSTSSITDNKSAQEPEDISLQSTQVIGGNIVQDSSFTSSSFASSPWSYSKWANTGSIDSEDLAMFSTIDEQLLMQVHDDDLTGEDKDEFIDVYQTMVRKYTLPEEQTFRLQSYFTIVLSGGSGAFAETTDIEIIIEMNGQWVTTAAHLAGTLTSFAQQSYPYTLDTTFTISDSTAAANNYETDYSIHIFLKSNSICFGQYARVYFDYFTVTTDYFDSPYSPPAAPTLVSPSNGAITSDTTPYFNWNDVTDATSYQIQIDDSISFSSPVTSYASGSAYTASTLASDIYYWRVRSQDQYGYYGSWSSVWYLEVDGIDPTVSLVSPANGWKDNDPTVYLDWTGSSDTVSYDIQVDDSSTFSSPIISTSTSNSYYTTSSLASNTYYWKVRAIDGAGNIGPYSVYRSFIVDITLPIVTLVSPTSGSEDKEETVYLDWTASSDSVSYYLQIDDYSSFSTPIFTVTTGGSYYTTPTMSSGTYYWRVRATDGVGNVGPYSSYRTFIVDTIPSEVTLVAPANGFEDNDPTVYLDWTSDADAVVFDIQVDVSSTFSSPIISTSTSSTYYTTGSLSSGTYYWRVRATDNVGNIGAWTSYRTFIVDTIPSTVTLVSPANGFEGNDPTVYLDWTSDADAVSFEIQVDDDSTFGTPIIDTTSSNTYYTASALADGVYYWRIRAIDDVGNIGIWTTYWSFEVDTILPVVSLLSPSTGTKTSDPIVYLDWSADADAVSFEIQVDDDNTFVTPIIDTTASNTYYTISSLTDGVYYWRIRATDGSGNVGAWTNYWSFEVDTTLPVVTLISPSEGSVTSDPTVYLDWSADADAVSYEIQVDDDNTFVTPIIDTTASNTYYTTSSLTDGVYYWRIRATDGSGNVGAWTNYWSFDIDTDTTGPTVTLISPSTGTKTSDPTVYLDWSADADAVSFEIQVDDDNTFVTPIIDTTASNTYYTTSSLTDGVYYWRIRATDGSGNVGAWTNYWSFEVNTDTTGPTVILISPSTGTKTSDPTVYLDWSADADAVSFEIQVDDDNTFVTPIIDTTGSSTYYTSSTLADGVYYWRIRATDGSGNVGLWTNYWSFEIDTSGPSITLETPSDGTVTSDPIIFLSWISDSDAVSFEVQVDNSSTFSSPLIDISTVNLYHTTSSLDDGVYYWRIRGTDGVGNVGVWISFWYFEINTQTTGPIATLISPLDQTVTDDPTVDLDWSADVEAVSFEIQVDDDSTFGTPIIDTSSSNTYYTTSTLADGVYYWRIRATDGSGNVGLWTTYWSFEISTDTTGPTVTLISPSDNTVTDDPTVDLDWSADAVSFEIQVDDSSAFTSPLIETSSTDSYYTTSALVDGVFYWRIRGTDAVGNVGLWTTFWSFEIDTSSDISGPIVTLLAPTNGIITNNPNVFLDWNSVNAFTFELQIDDDNTFGSPIIDTTTTDSSYNTAPLNDGAYYWRIRGIDIDGNVGLWTTHWTFEIDTSAPLVTLLSPSDGSVISEISIYLDWRSDAESFVIQIDDSSSFDSPLIDTSSISTEYTFSASFEGNYYWRVRAIDDIGNIGEWSNIWSFEVINPTSPTTPTESEEPESVGSNTQLIFTLISFFMISIVWNIRTKNRNKY